VAAANLAKNPAKVFFLALKRLFGDRLQINSSAIIRDWNYLAQHADESISAYWDRAQTISYRMASIQQEPTEVMFLEKVIDGLWDPDGFQVAITIFSTAKPRMDKAAVEALLIATERSVAKKREQETGGKALYGGGKPSGAKPNDICGYCKGTGHWKGECPVYRRDDPEGQARYNAQRKRGSPGKGPGKPGGGRGVGRGGRGEQGRGGGGRGSQAGASSTPQLAVIPVAKAGSAGIVPPNSPGYWGLDTCAGFAATFNRDILLDFQPDQGLNDTLEDAGGQLHKAKGVGRVELTLSDGRKVQISGVRFVPSFKFQLLSIGRSLELGWEGRQRMVGGKKVFEMLHPDSGFSFTSSMWDGVPFIMATETLTGKLFAPAIGHSGAEGSAAAADRAKAALALHKSVCGASEQEAIGSGGEAGPHRGDDRQAGGHLGHA
jgi:hypothetical protein